MIEAGVLRANKGLAGYGGDEPEGDNQESPFEVLRTRHVGHGGDTGEVEALFVDRFNANNHKSL